MSFVLFYTLFWMFNVLFYVIGYNSRHLNKKEHIWRKIELKQKVRLQPRAFCGIEENKTVALRLQPQTQKLPKIHL